MSKSEGPISLDAAICIIHRDMKPANIAVTKRGQAKIMDWSAWLSSQPEGAQNQFQIAVAINGLVKRKQMW